MKPLKFGTPPAQRLPLRAQGPQAHIGPQEQRPIAGRLQRIRQLTAEVLVRLPQRVQAGRLTPEQAQVLREWARALEDSMRALEGKLKEKGSGR